MSLLGVRQSIADQVAGIGRWTTYPFPPPVPQPMSVVLEPDDPYIQTSTHYGNACRMRLRVRMYVPLMDNESNLDQIEVLACELRALLNDQTQNVGDLSAPSALDLDTGQLLTAYFTLEVLTDWPTP